MAATEDPESVEHPLVAPGALEQRGYQAALAETARSADTLVCLPTGLGKTAVSLLVTAHRLDEAGGTSLLLAPTKPLVQQHAEFYREALTLPDDDVVVFTGEVRPDDRADLWAEARVVVATPQVIENDLIGGRIDLADVTHVTFDECHRATGDYAYGYIATRYHEDAADPLVTGMSASPGGDEEAILTVCENLGLDEVEVMTESDADVAEYTYETDIDWVEVSLPDEVVEIRDELNEVISDRLGRLAEIGVTNSTDPELSQRDLNRMRGKLQERIDRGESEGYQGMSVHAEVMKLRRAVELAETQSVEALCRYFERQENAARSSGASKASQRLVGDPAVQRAMRKAEAFDDLHPKFRQTRLLLARTLGVENGERVIVFTESRDTAEALTEFLSEGFAVRRFVGQGDKEGSDGMTQREQQETLDAFRAGEFSVLVSTSVAEEGLDVPDVDLVLFYEPVPTAIRSIQRKGRTGRQDEGRVVVLMAEDTRDEAYFWISKRREQEMESELRKLKGVAEEVEAELADGQETLDEFDESAADGDADGSTDEAALTDYAAAADPSAQTGDEDGTASDVGGGNETARDDGDGDGTASDTGDEDETARDDGDAPVDIGEADDPDGDGTASDTGDEDETARDDGDAPVDIGEADDPDGDGTASDTGDEDETARDDGDAPVDIGEADDPDGDAEGEDLQSGTVATPDIDDTVEVVVDQRELDSTIARDLSTRLETRLETLEVGDYVCSDRVVVERKTVSDFLSTLLSGDRSLFDQAAAMSRHYARPVVIVEGADLYGERDVHPDAIRGALSSLVVDFGVSVLRTEDAGDTADLLAVLARREQETRDRTVSAHGETAAKTLDEQQEYVISSIADVGPVTARSLLAHFGTVEAVMTARGDDLREVSGVGEVTAERIREVVGSEYEPPE